jgi:hypothetical protein
METEPIAKTKEQIELENELPEMVATLEYLRKTEPVDDEELEEYDTKLLKVIGWTDRAFEYDKQHSTKVRSLLGNPEDLKNEFDKFHKKIIDLEFDR